VNLDRTRAIKQLERIGVFMIGQTAEICPADKKLYALRDVTGTVPSRPVSHFLFRAEDRDQQSARERGAFHCWLRT